MFKTLYELFLKSKRISSKYHQLHHSPEMTLERTANHTCVGIDIGHETMSYIYSVGPWRGLKFSVSWRASTLRHSQTEGAV